MSIKINCRSQEYAQFFERELPEVRSQELFDEMVKSIQCQNVSPDCVRFHLIRHGESTGKTKNLAGGGTDADPLTEKGAEQAKQLAEQFFNSQTREGRCFAAIFFSPAKAAVETAQAVAEKLSLSFHSDDRLRQKHWGRFHGQPICKEYREMKLRGEEASEHLRTFKEKFEFKFEQEPTPEESLQQVFERVTSFMRDIVAQDQFKGKEIIVLTHTPVLKAYFSALVAAEKGLDMEYHWFDFENGAKVSVDVNEAGEVSLISAEQVKFRGAKKYQ